MQFRFIFVVAAMFLASASLHARDATTPRNVRVAHPYARSTVPGQASGAAYLTIENQGKQADKLIAITSPVAKSVEIHTMSMEGDVMKMREVQSIELKPHAKIAMNPGDGYHIMLIGLKQPLKRGDKFPLTLSFENSGKVDVSVTVEDPGAAK